MSGEIPKGAEVMIDGLYYKIGRFGRPYYWNDSEWINSRKDLSLIEDKIDTGNHSLKLKE